MASVNEKHFKAGGGNAAVKKLLAAQAGAARQLTGASQSSQQTAKPTEAQLARLRARVAARGKAELDRQSKESDRKEASETTYSGNKVYRNGKHIGNMVNGKLVKLGEGPKRDPKIKKQQYPVTIGTVEDKKKDPPKATTSTPPRTSPPRSTPPRTTSSSSSSSSSSSTPPRRRPPTATPPVPKGVVEKTADRYKAKTKTVADRKKYLQTKKGGSLSKRLAAALADKDALKFKG